jgi:hypothetical protein
MTTSSLSPNLLRIADAGVRRPNSRAQATGLLARWCAAHFARPLNHRLGAFDLARSDMARAVLERNASRRS